MSRGLFSTRTTLAQPIIVAPYDFDFHLRHYVIAPELRERQTLVELVRLSSGVLVKVDVASCGTVDGPRLELTISCYEPLASVHMDEVRERVAWHLSVDDDLRPLYAIAQEDPVLSASVEHNWGAKRKRAASMFDALIDVVLFQNTAFRRTYMMRANLAAAFGDSFDAGGRVYHAAPTPERLAAASTASETAKVGYRDRYIKGVAIAVVEGMDLEALKQLPGEEARRELMLLPGVGPYTADLALIRASRRPDSLFLDSYVRKLLRQLYFGGSQVSDEELREFANERWAACQAYAAFYLTTDADVWGAGLAATFTRHATSARTS